MSPIFKFKKNVKVKRTLFILTSGANYYFYNFVFSENTFSCQVNQ